MKKIIIGIFVFILLIITALAVIPIFFKDKIIAVVQKTINERVNAQVSFKDFDLSLFSNFPRMTISLENLQVSGKGEFTMDTLLKIQDFELALNLSSVLFGEDLTIEKIRIAKGNIFAHVLKNGKANWDIAIPDSAVQTQDTSKTTFKLKLAAYALADLNIRYWDETMPLNAQLTNLNHRGSGDFTESLFDLSTKTDIQKLLVEFDGTRYLNQVAFKADVNLGIDLNKNQYSFKDNFFEINDLKIGLQGNIAMPGEDIALDISLKALKTEFQSVLSLVPGIYTESFKDLKTEGKFELTASAKGIYNKNTLPTIAAKLGIENGFFKYPELPEPVSKVNVTASVNLPNGNIEALELKIPQFHAEIGKNPIDLKLNSTGMKTINLDATLKANADLATLSKVIPLEKTVMKGTLFADVEAKGTYSPNQYPQVKAKISLENGFYQSADFPMAIENLNLSMTADNPTGQLKDMRIDLTNFHAELDKQPIDGKLIASNMEDINYELFLKGKLDLEKLIKVYPLEGTQMKGVLIADIQSQGKQSAATSGKYDQLPTSGTLLISDFSYKSTALPQGITIQSADLKFSPKDIALSSYQGTVGKSDIALNGAISNYIAYVLSDAPIKGNLTLNSRKFDANEWMSSQEVPENSSADSVSSLTVVDIPANIDFLLQANIDQILYDNLKINEFKSGVLIKDKTVRLVDAGFSVLGGRMVANGTYSTKDIAKPTIDFGLTLSQLSFKETYDAFYTMQRFVPIAQNIAGKFNANLHFSTLLRQDMMPDLGTLSASGLVETIDAILSDFPVLNKMQDYTKISHFSTINIGNTRAKFTIADGKLNLEPMDIKFSDYQMNVSGYTALDQSIKYVLKMDVPTGTVGAAAVSAITKFTGQNINAPQRLKFDLFLGGTIKNPTITGGAVGNSAANTVKEQVTNEIKNQVNEQTERAKQEAERIRKEAEDKARAEADRIRKEAENKARAEADRAKKEAEQRAKEEAERLKREAENKLKDKFRWPK